MQVILRLYRRHDADLLLLHKTKGFSLQKALKSALYMHIGLANERPIEYPDCSNVIHDFYSISQVHLILHENNDYDMAVAKFLHDVPTGYRNSYCKNLIRYYLEKPKKFMLSDNKIFFGKGD